MTSLDVIAELGVRRKFYIGLINKQKNAGKALARRALGYDPQEDGEDSESKERASRIVDTALKGKDQKPEDLAVAARIAGDLAILAQALDPLQSARNAVELDMEKAVRKLPVYPWVKSVRGLGDLSCAVILAETGDLSNYPDKGRLWKRLGLSPRDGKAMSTWRREGGLTAEEWTDAGYAPRRRAEVFAMMDPLFRAQAESADKETGAILRPAGLYRTVYDARKARAGLAHPDWTKMHLHMDALRVMTKHAIRDLWREWRRAEKDHTGRALT